MESRHLTRFTVSKYTGELRLSFANRTGLSRKVWRYRNE